MRNKRFFIFCLMASLCLLIATCSVFETLGVTKIKYEVTGTASSVFISMNNADEGIEEWSDVSLPWSKEFNVMNDCDKYYFAYISAYNEGNSGNITAKIYVNGSLFKSATSQGAHVKAVASGRVKVESTWVCDEDM